MHDGVGRDPEIHPRALERDDIVMDQAHIELDGECRSLIR